MYLKHKIGSTFWRCRGSCSYSTNKYKKLDKKLTQKMIELRSKSLGHFTTINSIIIKFPKLREDIRVLSCVFDKHDEDHNGGISHEEVEKCLEELQINLTKQDMHYLFHSCDFHHNNKEGIQLNDFILLLCLLHLLTKSSETNMLSLSRLGSPQLEETLDTIVEAFLFMDKNGDGILNKKDLVMALTEGPWETSPIHLTNTRFREMDKDGDGHVSFREFLSALISWLGIDIEDQTIPVTGD